ncbi:hypothetical protein HNQ59_002013 [Chitinivorax tropicus]|uniref:Uncharacterized protein n=1 Tax=Chitinivorax tropicus TaxID=714531 RepID=A0A840MJZ7_9PROT|nr:hypothetical protein [Chitinivorax tropicus]
MSDLPMGRGSVHPSPQGHTRTLALRDAERLSKRDKGCCVVRCASARASRSRAGTGGI